MRQAVVITYILLVQLFCCGATAEEVPAGGPGQYMSERVGDLVYGFSWPGGWELVEAADNAAGVVLSGNSRVAVIFQVRDLKAQSTGELTAEEYLDVFKAQLGALYTDFRITDKQPCILNGTGGYTIDYEYSDDRDPAWRLKNRACIAVIDGRYGVLTSYMSTPELFSEY
ncbi:MAG: hypothetical protein GF392_04780, partial [Candidatus Omnitrophica bacterium]|nr:hypothetical protein [Candidatus Omnitrophota bacterium]